MFHVAHSMPGTFPPALVSLCLIWRCDVIFNQSTYTRVHRCSSIFRLLDVIWRRSMNPLLYYDSIYSLTSMKKQEDSYRQFIFEFISSEWNKLLAPSATDSESMSFIHQLFKVSNDGRKYTKDEVNDHVGTMLVAVSCLWLRRVKFKERPWWKISFPALYKCFFWFTIVLKFRRIFQNNRKKFWRKLNFSPAL